MMRTGFFLALLFVCCQAGLRAQQYAYRVSFTDKNTTTHTLTNPIAYLSQRAIDRRTADGIAIDSTDLPVPDAYVQGVLTASSGILHTKSRWFNHIVILVSDQADIIPVQSLPYVSGTLQVGDFAVNLHNREAPQPVSNPDKYSLPTEGLPLPATMARSTGSPAYYGNTWDQTDMVKGDYLHDQGFKGAGILIAVLDDGYAAVPTHPGLDSLRSENRIWETHNFVLDTPYIYSIPSNHGTSVLGTMAANVPGTYVGAAPHAYYALYITENLTSEKPVEMEQVLAATERADSIGADVISISGGYNTFDNPYPDLTSADLNGNSTIAAQAASMATAKGILFVATAGNEGGGGLLTPGDADSALTIGAVLPNGNAWNSSSHGPNGAGHVKPDVVTLGAPAAVLSSTAYITGNGTSYSTPQIAGWAACLRQAKPNATPRMIRAAIDSSAHVHTAPEVQRGFGIPNFQLAADMLSVPFVISRMSDWASVAPNPTGNDINLFTNLSLSDDVACTITDVSGRVVTRLTAKADSGVSKTTISLPGNTAPGIYFLKVISGSREATIKIVKDK